jgi:hypothetical protein
LQSIFPIAAKELIDSHPIASFEEQHHLKIPGTLQLCQCIAYLFYFSGKFVFRQQNKRLRPIQNICVFYAHHHSLYSTFSSKKKETTIRALLSGCIISQALLTVENQKHLSSQVTKRSLETAKLFLFVPLHSWKIVLIMLTLFPLASGILSSLCE